MGEVLLKGPCVSSHLAIWSVRDGPDGEVRRDARALQEYLARKKQPPPIGTP